MIISDKIQNTEMQGSVATETNQKKGKILYVDDSDMNLTLFQASFEKDFEILLAESGPEGLEIMRNNEIAVIISDQRMPGMSGTELLEIVAKEFPDTVRFILTAFTDYDTVVESVNRGQIYGFFNKPFDADNVRQSVRKALELYELRSEKSNFIKQLEKANQELMGMDKARTRFLNSITTEIRSPLQKIMSALHMLKNKADSKDLSELISFLDNSVSKLDSFTKSTNQLVELRSRESGINAKKISLQELIEISIIEKKELFTQAGIRVSMGEGSQATEIMAEEGLILSAIAIIISSLCEFMQGNGELKITSSENEENILLHYEFKGTFSVSDYQSWVEVFNNRESDHFESNIEQILIIEILEAHKGQVKFKETENHSIMASLEFPKKF